MGPVARLIGWLSVAADDSRLAGLGVALVCGMVAIGSMDPVVDPDFGWHLALGRFIAEAGAIPDTEFLTHTAAGVPMVAHEWLSQLLMYGASAVWGGVFATRWLLAAASSGVAFLFFVWMRRSGVRPALSLLGTIVFLVVAQGRFQPRPHMFHLLFLVALYGYLFVGRPKLKPAQLVGIFCATAIWANFHSAVLIFPGIVGLYVAAEFTQQWIGWRHPEPSDLGEGRLPRLFVLALGVVVASFMTPHSFGIIPYVFESFRANSHVSTEWFPITHFWDRRASFNYTVEAFWILLSVTWLVALARVRQASMSRWAVVLALSCMPLAGIRYTSVYFAPVLFVFGALSDWLQCEPTASLRAKWRRFIPIAAMVGSMVIASQVLNFPKGFEWLGRYPRAADNFRKDFFPIGAVDFLNQVQLDARLYAPGHWGGYVSWETNASYPTFSDGRWVTLGPEVVQDSGVIARRRSRAARLLEKYGVDLLLVPRGWMKPGSGRWNRDWVSLFENFNAGAYLRRTPQTRNDLERVRAYYQSKHIAFDSDSGFAAEAAARENPRWAKRFGVRDMHIEQFGMSVSDVARGQQKRVHSW